MESFDDMIRRKLAQRPVPEFEERDWLAAEKLLDEHDRQRRRRGLAFWLWPLAGLMLGGLGAYGYLLFREKQLAEAFAKARAEQTVQEKGLQKTDTRLENGQPTNKETIDNGQSISNKKIENRQAINPKPVDNFEKQIAGEAKGGGKQPPRFPQKGATGGRPLFEKNPDQKGTGGKATADSEADRDLPKKEGNTGAGDQKATGQSGVSAALFSEKNEGQQLVVASGASALLLEKKASNLPGADLSATGFFEKSPAEKQPQPIENQSVGLSPRMLFLIEILEGRTPGPPGPLARRAVKFPAAKPLFKPIANVKAGGRRTQFGIQTGGLASKEDGDGKRTYGGQIGLFAERKLARKLAAQLSVDYRWLGGLGATFDTDPVVDSVFRYSFGLGTVSGEPVPIAFHNICPGLSLRYNFIGKHWIEGGLAARVWYGSRVKLTTVSEDIFEEAEERTTKGFSTENLGWRRTVPELRIGWAAGLGRGWQVAAGYNYQLQPLATASDLVPGRYLQKGFFDIKLRYLLF